MEANRLMLSMLFLFSLPCTSTGQTLHAIVACDVSAEGIGPSVEHDKSIISKLLRQNFAGENAEQPNVRFGVPKNTDLTASLTALGVDGSVTGAGGLNLVLLEPEQITPEGILSSLKALSIEKDDAVLFYYSGHGSTAAELTQGHELVMDGERLSRQRIWDAIVQGKTEPHMAAVVTDCCFSKPAAGEFTVTDPSSEGTQLLQSLFFDCKQGTRVDINSCAPYQSSVAQNQVGSAFSRAFRDVVQKHSAKTLDWTEFYGLLRKRTAEIAETELPRRGERLFVEFGGQRIIQMSQVTYLNPTFCTNIAPHPKERLGMTVKNENRAVVVREVSLHSPAAKALAVNDKLLEVNGQRITDASIVPMAILNSPQKVKLKLLRKDVEITPEIIMAY